MIKSERNKKSAWKRERGTGESGLGVSAMMSNNPAGVSGGMVGGASSEVPSSQGYSGLHQASQPSQCLPPQGLHLPFPSSTQATQFAYPFPFAFPDMLTSAAAASSKCVYQDFFGEGDYKECFWLSQNSLGQRDSIVRQRLNYKRQLVREMERAFDTNKILSLHFFEKKRIDLCLRFTRSENMGNMLIEQIKKSQLNNGSHRSSWTKK